MRRLFEALAILITTAGFALTLGTISASAGGPQLPPITEKTTTQRTAGPQPKKSLIRDTNLNLLFAGDGSTVGGLSLGYATLANSSPVSLNGTLDAIGDSFSVGSVASPLTNGWVYLLANANGWTVNNHAVSGSQVCDQAPIAYGLTPARGQNFTVALGTNDIYSYQNTPGRLDLYRRGMAALLAYLAIPNNNGNKYLGSDTTSITYTGSWSSSPYYPIGRVSTTNGNTATFTVVGTSVYISTSAINSNGGYFSVSVDGTNITAPVNPDGTTASGFQCFPYNTTVTSAIGTVSVSPMLYWIQGLQNGTHTVVITVTSPTNAANQVVIDWVAGNGGAQFWNGPFVWCPNMTRATAAQYAAAGTTEQASNWIYNRNILDVVKMLAADRLSVHHIDFCGVINPTSSDVSADGLHPTNQGHSKLAQAAIQATNALQYPSDRMGSGYISALQQYLTLDLLNNRVGFNMNAGARYLTSEMVLTGVRGTPTPSPVMTFLSPNIVGQVTGIQFAAATQYGFIGSILKTGGGAGHVFFSTQNSSTGEFMRYDAIQNALGINTKSPTKDLSFGGNSARTVWLERNTNSATVGQDLSVSAGGAFTGGTNLNGGNLKLQGGIGTGTGSSSVQIQVSPAGSTGTTDNALTTLFQVSGAGGGSIGFYGATPVTKPVITGSRGGNAALTSLLSQMAAQGSITDNTTP